MRAGNTARVGAMRVGGSRVGAVFNDIQSSPSSGEEYPWSMIEGPKPLDTNMTEDDWTEVER